MARDAPPTTSYSGLYAHLLAAAEDESRHSMPRPGNAARLAALRAGEPVDVQAGDLPAWARPAGERMHWWRRAIVSADGAVEFYDDSGAMFLAEHGL
jgi:hypothetical protein